MALVLSSGGSVNTFAYSITGPSTYSGSINVASSSTVSAVIGNIAVGTGYSLTLTGTSVDGKTSCAGASAPFNVVAGGHHLRGGGDRLPCRPHHRHVLVNGTINICPNIDSVSANPPAGNVIATREHRR